MFLLKVTIIFQLKRAQFKWLWIEDFGYNIVYLFIK